MLEEKVISNISDLTQGDKISNIACAVSGGMDSMALAIFVNKWAKKNNIQNVAIIINHNLRKSSKNEAQTTADYLNSIGIESTILHWEHDIINTGIEEKARQKRYELLFKYCNDKNISHLFLGHHLNDQIETFFLNLSRGSGIDGLSCMAEKMENNTIQIIRPLLKFRKIDLQFYLETKNIKWIEDESNNDTKFTRNKIRKLLTAIDFNNQLESRIIDTISSMQRNRNTMEKLNRINYQNLVSIENNINTIKRSEFIKLTEEEQYRILSTMIYSISSKEKKSDLLN